jgi:predicted DNA-binding transcriptional regulator YafY
MKEKLDQTHLAGDGRLIVIRYKNYRGETSDRRIIPLRIRFASSDWHPDAQWLLDAFDLDRGAERSFAIKDISRWGA